MPQTPETLPGKTSKASSQPRLANSYGMAVVCRNRSGVSEYLNSPALGLLRRLRLQGDPALGRVAVGHSSGGFGAVMLGNPTPRHIRPRGGAPTRRRLRGHLPRWVHGSAAHPAHGSRQRRHPERSRERLPRARAGTWTWACQLHSLRPALTPSANRTGSSTAAANSARKSGCSGSEWIPCGFCAQTPGRSAHHEPPGGHHHAVPERLA